MSKLGIVCAAVYLILVGIVFANELYVRLYDRGNSAMAGLATFLLSSPSSFLIDRLSNFLFGVAVGASDTAFISILSVSIISNAALLYFLVVILQNLVRAVK
jgi:hypothetical protein